MRRDGFFLHLLQRNGDRIVGLERRSAGEHFVQNQAQRINVSAVIDRFSADLLRGHVLRRSNHRAGHARQRFHRARDAEVHDLYVAVRVDHDIFRLQIAVNDSLRVRFFESRANLQRQIYGLALRQAAKAVEHRTEALAFHKFHGGVSNAAHAIELMHAANIFVGNFARKEEFVLEALHHGLV